MRNIKVIFIVTISILYNIAIINLHSQTINELFGYSVGDTVKVLDKSNFYDARIYYFIDRSTCEIYENNINTIRSYFEDISLEYVVFVSKEDIGYTNELAKKNKWDFPVIADEYAIYKEFYKVKAPPVMITLNNSGKILEIDKLGSSKFEIDSLVNLIKSNAPAQREKNIMKKGLMEIKRIKVKKDSLYLSTGIYRIALFSEKYNLFILSDMRKCQLIIIDSTGNVVKLINNKTHSQYRCGLIHDMSWAINDKLIYIFGTSSSLLDDTYQFYDIEKDTMGLQHQILPLLERPKKDIGSESHFLTGNNKFVYYIVQSANTNRKLNDNDTLINLFDIKENKIIAFDTPDSIFKNYNRSPMYEMIFAFDKKRNCLLSLQYSSNLLKLWDINGIYINTLPLDLGSQFRLPQKDVGVFSSKQEVMIYVNDISFPNIIVDESNSDILIKYTNEIIPEGVFDRMSDQVKKEVYLNIFDSTGNKLNKNDILMPEGCIPIYMKDSYIYTTEVNKGKLELVIYKFIK